MGKINIELNGEKEIVKKTIKKKEINLKKIDELIKSGRYTNEEIREKLGITDDLLVKKTERIEVELRIHDIYWQWKQYEKFIEFSVKKDIEDDLEYLFSVNWYPYENATDSVSLVYRHSSTFNQLIRIDLEELADKNNNYLRGGFEGAYLYLRIYNSDHSKYRMKNNKYTSVSCQVGYFETLSESQFNNTRQLLNSYNISTKLTRSSIVINGQTYQNSCKPSVYEGCGIDAAQGFMKWISDNITRSTIKRSIKTTNLTPDLIKNGDTFTTPLQLEVGLRNLINKTQRKFKNKVIRIQENDDVKILKKIVKYIQSGVPVIALVGAGTHWVNIVGVEYVSKDQNGEIDFTRVQEFDIKILDLTAGKTYYINYSTMKICNWTPNDIANIFHPDYLPGTLITLEDNHLKTHYGIDYHHTNKTIYSIEIKTGSSIFSGTNATISIKLIGIGGESEWLILDDSRDNFERDGIDIFGFYKKDVGEITKIRLKHSNKDDDWFVSKVVIHKYCEDYKHLKYMFLPGQLMKTNSVITVQRYDLIKR